MLKNEYELKYRLEARDYDCLVESMKNYPSEKVVQKNYYYDTYNQDLRKNNITMRVREKNGKAYGTIKRHLGNHTSTEEYFAVTLPRQILLYEGQDVYQAGMIREGVLLSVRIGREIRIPKTELIAYIRGNR